MDLEKKPNFLRWIMGRYIATAALLLILLAVILLDFICSPFPKYMISGELDPTSKVIVTLEDYKYHVLGCPEIRGTTETMRLGAAVGKDVESCQLCIKK